MKNPKKASVASCLSDDLLEWGILPHLPAKALMRFKCVSKKWHSLISNPHHRFVRLQLQQAATCFVPCQCSSADKYLSGDRGSVGIPCMNSLGNLGRKMVVASNNGIFCIFCYRGRSLLIGNPTLKDWKPIPGHKSFTKGLWEQPHDHGTSAFGLAVDVGESSVEYKLALLKSVHETYHLYVFSSKSYQWKTFKLSINLESSCFDLVAVRVKENIYWRLATGGTDAHLLCYNFEEDNFGFLPQRLILSYSECHGRLGESGGKLRYAVILNKGFCMWTFDQSNWTKKFFITMCKPSGRELKAFYSKHTTSLRMNTDVSSDSGNRYMMPFEGGDTLSFIWGTVMYSYNMLTDEIHNQNTVERIDFSWLPYNYRFPYKNSLVSVRTKEQEDGMNKLK